MRFQYTEEDRMSPVYCTTCGLHLPKLVSDANNGLCPDCLGKAGQESSAVPPQPTAPQGTAAPEGIPAEAKKPGALNWQWQVVIVIAILYFLSFFFGDDSGPPAASSAETAAPSSVPIVDRGVKPLTTGVMGATPEVISWIRQNVGDFNLVQIIECSPVVEFEDYAWAQRVKLSGASLFGEAFIAEAVFVIKDGQVIGASELESETWP